MLKKLQCSFTADQLAATLVCPIFLWLFIGISLFAQTPAGKSSRDNASLPAEAKITFGSVCASCHGLDGRGGERGPDIASRPEVLRKSDAELITILKDGRPAAGMPPFATYGVAKITALVSYLRSLQGRPNEEKFPGDPQVGESLFYGKAKCSDCHMVSGRGGFFGQDLTDHAARKSAMEIRAAILNPDRDLDPRRGMARVVLSSGTKFSGVVRNEDNFSIQLQTMDGAFHLLNKSDIRMLTYSGASAMPSDYGTTLNNSEINDLVSFLLRSARTGSTEKELRDRERDEEE